MGTLQMDPSAPNAPFHNDTRRYISLPNVVRRGNAIKGRHFPGTPRRSGFTLVEVLCIVAIVAILVGLSLAVLTKGIARAYRVDVINMLRNGAVNAQARIAIGVAGAQLPRDICRA
ncbi:MAG: type II secretion system protein, partial [Candidatus Hydrogenedentes bacterium]|nr:type II secretion system protein [Candidatus Hydrogenedentota bacterium]